MRSNCIVDPTMSLNLNPDLRPNANECLDSNQFTHFGHSGQILGQNPSP